MIFQCTHAVSNDQGRMGYISTSLQTLFSAQKTSAQRQARKDKKERTVLSSNEAWAGSSRSRLRVRPLGQCSTELVVMNGSLGLGCGWVVEHSPGIQGAPSLILQRRKTVKKNLVCGQLSLWANLTGLITTHQISKHP